MSRAELVAPGVKQSRQPRADSRRERERSLARRAGALLIGVLMASAAAGAASAKDLVGVYEDALRNDPTIRAADANRLASRESRPQALAALLPQITGSGAYTRDHSSGFVDQPNGVQDPVTKQVQFFVAPIQYSQGFTQRQWGLNLRENVFSWSNWLTLKAANSQVAQAEATYAAAEQNLILRVCQAYFTVLSALDNLQAQEASLEAIARQLDQADKRYDVGLIAITDVQEAKSARDTASAAVIAAKRTLATAEDQLEEITGEKYDSLAKPGDDMPLSTPQPADESKWVNISLDQNSTLIAARLNADIARDNVQVAFGGHLPTVEIVAGRTFTEQSGPYSFGSSSNGGPSTGTVTLDGYGNKINDRQISLQVSVPIFSGGATQSKVRQSQYLWIAAKEQMTQTSRATERQARDAYLGVISGIARVQALRQALESSQTALKATEAGYEVGTRTAVDVLNARRTLVQAQTDYSGSRYDFIISIIQLKLAAGNLDRPQVEQINSWLSIAAPTSPRIETPEGLTPKLPPTTITAPVTPQSVLPPPNTPQPPGRQPRNP